MPKAFDDTAKSRFLNLVHRGHPPAIASESVGFTWATVQRHLRDDIAFAEGFEQAIEVVDGRVQAVAYDFATDGEHPAFTLKWLERRRRAEWADTRSIQHTVSGPGGGPVQLAAVTTQALRNVLIGVETRQAALALVDEVPIIDVPSEEVPL